VSDIENTESSLKKEMKSLGKNSLVYMIGQALSRAVGFFMIPLYTRYIAPDNYGAMEMIEILSSILMITISIGVSDGMSRYYYSEKDIDKRNEVVSTVILGFTLIAIPIVSLFLVGSSFLSKLVLDEESYRYILQLAFITCFFGMFCDVGYSYLRIVYRAKLFVVMTVLQLVIALTLNIWFVAYLKLNVLGIFYSTLISQAFVGCIMTIWVLKKVGMRLSPKLLIDILKFGAPLIPSRIGLMLGFLSNRFFLRWFGAVDPVVALAQIGLFSLGHKFAVIVNRFVTVPLNSYWAPRRMELIFNDKVDSRETIARVCTYATFLSIFAGLLLVAAIESIIDIMAAPSYKGAHIIVPFVVLSYIALGLETHFMTGILYCKKTKFTTYITIISLFIILLWNFVFIPKYGLIGAATSNLAGYSVRLALIYFVSQRLHTIPFEVGRLFTMLVASIILFFISQFVVFNSPYVNLLARTAVVATYPLLLYIAGFFHKGERQFIHDTIRNGGKSLKISMQTVFIK